MKPSLPSNEDARLQALAHYEILDTLPEQAFDDITHLASQICDTPIALISLVDRDRQWFKSRVGLEATQTSRDIAFCAHAILEPKELFVVSDATKDARFSANPLVIEAPDIRFYAGAPLVTSGGEALGTICVIDRAPKNLTGPQGDALRALSRQVMTQLELRATVAQLHRNAGELTAYQTQLEEYQRKLETTNAELERKSATDSLTGLLNRRAFFERAEAEVDRARRYGSTLSLVMVDVDRFKSFNDTFGHPLGDDVLTEVAQVLQNSCRNSDVPARHGGEEFIILLPNTDSTGAVIMAERFRKAVETATWPKRPITISLGISTMDEETGSVDELIKRADGALYQSKNSGRNRVTRAEDMKEGQAA